MPKRSLRYYYELLARSAKGIDTARRLLKDAETQEVYDAAFAKTVMVKQFELAYELLIKLMFKAADRLPEPTVRDAPLSWKEAHRVMVQLKISNLTERDYNRFKQDRNQTVHTYNVDVFEEAVAPILDEFEKEVLHVLACIEPLLPDEA